MHSDALLTHLDVLRDAGMMITTPTEARVRGDLILLVGSGLLEAWPELRERLLAAPLASASGTTKRRIVWLCPDRDEAREHESLSVQRAGEAAELPSALAWLRARAADHPVAPYRLAQQLEPLVPALKGARFGVAVWSAAALDPLSAEMLCGLVSDLNRATRFTSLPLLPGDNAGGVNQACAWTTGFPVRTGFGRSDAEHDPWRFDTRRLVNAGEADCAVWISAYSGFSPEWRRAIPTIALGGADIAFKGTTPRVRIAVGRPGIDHDAVQHDAATGTLTAVAAAQPSGALSVAEALSRISSLLPGPTRC
jgi:formylmethanofuran dehydrogenase subunit B